MVTSLKKNYLIITFGLGLIAFQFFLFQGYLMREIVGFYPANHDQASYLPFTYELFEDVQQGTLLLALKKMVHTLYTGVIFPLYALIVFEFIGPSRFAALLPNLLLFILLQLNLYLTIKTITNKNSLSLLAVSLLLCFNTPFLVGGITDYRMDFLGFCLYGIFTSVVIRSNSLSRSSFVFAAATIATIMTLTRFITFFYVMPLIFAGLCYLVLYKKKLTPFLISCFLFTFTLLPSIIVNFPNLYQYYVVGHITGAEAALRGMPSGASLLQSLLYYPNSVITAHIGKLGIWVISIVFLFFAIGFVWKDNSSQRVISLRFNCNFLLLALFIPIAMLTTDPSKSIVVGSIVVVPLLLLFMMLCIFLDDHWNINNKITSGLSLIILVIALIHQNYYYHVHSSAKRYADLNMISKMYIDIGNYVTKKNWNDVLFATDQIKDSVYFGCLNTLYYEKYKKLISVHREWLGANLLALSEKDALGSIARSNVAILTMDNYPDTWPPYQQAFATYRQKIINYAEKHFKILGDYMFQGNLYRVYVA